MIDSPAPKIWPASINLSKHEWHQQKIWNFDLKQQIDRQDNNLDRKVLKRDRYSCQTNTVIRIWFKHKSVLWYWPFPSIFVHKIK